MTACMRTGATGTWVARRFVVIVMSVMVAVFYGRRWGYVNQLGRSSLEMSNSGYRNVTLAKQGGNRRSVA
jgi:hypothetical protein